MSDSTKAAAPAPVLGASGKEVCRAFRNKGECRYANECKYEHSKGDPITVPPRDFKPKGDCHSWEKDKACKFGDRCRFLHGADDKRETYRPARPERKADNAGGKPQDGGAGGDRRRRRRRGPRSGGGGGGGGAGQGAKPAAERKQTPKPAAQYDKDGMEICRKHQQGACRFGTECTYSHGVPDPKAKPKEPKDQKDGGRPRRQRRRRAPGGGAANGGGGGGGGGGAGGDKDGCFDFAEKRNCEYGDDCRFRHGAGDKRDLKKVRRRTNGPCYALRDQGKCEYGDDCRFSHDPADQDQE